MIIMLMALLLYGVHLIVYPLLVLTADQVSSFARCTGKFGSVIVINLDDQASLSVSFLDHIVCLVLGLSTNTTTNHQGVPLWITAVPCSQTQVHSHDV